MCIKTGVTCKLILHIVKWGPVTLERYFIEIWRLEMGQKIRYNFPGLWNLITFTVLPIYTSHKNVKRSI